MTGRDWHNCWGEVFRIYRALGGGHVRVGDPVGLYFPKQRRWFGCWGNPCGKATCPGSPTHARGFASLVQWFHCAGEVFLIYANGKRQGQVIRSGDDIMLYYVRGRNWVSFDHGHGYARKRRCPGGIPPHPSKFDICTYEVMKIMKW